jgi:chromatin segregation and condensation protein Rec8/ScpA/Scc1 (kleisin family)
LLFSTLAGGEPRRADVVVTLLAVLELVRQGRIRAQQTELFGEIVLERQTEANLGSGGSVSAPPQ